MLLIKTVEHWWVVGKLILGDYMEFIEFHELRVREKKVSAIKAEKTVDFEDIIVVGGETAPVRAVVIGNLEDFINIEGGEKVEDCRNHVFNMCPAVGGNEPICEDCLHKEWVMEYKQRIARLVSREVKAKYNRVGLKAFKEMADE